jgi:plastocyanin
MPMACGGADDSTTAGKGDVSSTTAASEGGVNSTTAGEGRVNSATVDKGDVTKFPVMDSAPYDPYVRYVADPKGSIAFNIAEASASPGDITLELVNSQKTPHNVALEDSNGDTIAETKTVSEAITSIKAVVKPGVYVAYCSVPGHRKAGMVGHLTVSPE